MGRAKQDHHSLLGPNVQVGCQQRNEIHVFHGKFWQEKEKRPDLMLLCERVLLLVTSDYLSICLVEEYLYDVGESRRIRKEKIRVPDSVHGCSVI